MAGGKQTHFLRSNVRAFSFTVKGFEGQVSDNIRLEQYKLSNAKQCCCEIQAEMTSWSRRVKW